MNGRKGNLNTKTLATSGIYSGSRMLIQHSRPSYIVPKATSVLDPEAGECTKYMYTLTHFKMWGAILLESRFQANIS